MWPKRAKKSDKVAGLSSERQPNSVVATGRGTRTLASEYRIQEIEQCADFADK